MRLPFVCGRSKNRTSLRKSWSSPKDEDCSTSDRGIRLSQRVEARLGKLPLSGRYHRAPERTIADDYIVSREVLGTGFNGEVRLAHQKNQPASSQRYAVKTFKLSQVPPHKRELLECEVEVLLCMDHPHVARLFDVYESEKSLHLVMECLEGGELFDKLVTKTQFEEADSAEAAWQILLSLNYIHSHGICHRDLKLENFMYDSKDRRHLKLIDFGFSKMFDQGGSMHAQIGTVEYMAPEVLKKEEYTSQCDMWSAGVIIFSLLFGYMPFSGNNQDVLINKIREGEYSLKPHVWKHISHEAQHFTLSLLEVEPAQRLTAQAALEEPWLQRRHRGRSADIGRPIINALREFGHASTFRRCCLEMMAWCLSNADRSKVRDYFITMDKNHQGTITLEELSQVLETQPDVPRHEANYIFQMLDTNRDHEIHYSDFLAAMVDTQIGIHDDLLKQCFRRFDTDASGYITEENLQSVLGTTFEGEHVEKLLAEADLLHDGRISYPEFVSYLRGDPLSPVSPSTSSKILQLGKNLSRSFSKRSATSVHSKSSVSTTATSSSVGSASSEALEESCDVPREPESPAGVCHHLGEVEVGFKRGSVPDNESEGCTHETRGVGCSSFGALFGVSPWMGSFLKRQH